MIKTDAGRLLYKIYVPLTLFVKFEKVIQGLRVRGSWRPNRNCNILTPTLMAVNVESFSFSWCSTGGPGRWLSLLHLIRNFSGPQLNQGPRALFGLVWLSLPHFVYNSVRSLIATNSLLSRLSYIIVQRPLSRLLDFWNRMLDRHQSEITVMQFTGHSLPVHQSMSVPWEIFTSSHFISQFPPTRFPLITAIRMCHFLPVLHLRKMNQNYSLDADNFLASKCFEQVILWSLHTMTIWRSWEAIVLALLAVCFKLAVTVLIEYYILLC